MQNIKRISKISEKGKYSNDAAGRPGYCKCECRQCRRESAVTSGTRGGGAGGAGTPSRRMSGGNTEESEYAEPPTAIPPPIRPPQLPHLPHLPPPSRTTTARITTVDAERPGKASKLFTLLALPFPDQNVGRRYLDDPNGRKWAGYFSQQQQNEQTEQEQPPPRAC